MPDMGAVCLTRLMQEGVNIIGVVPPPKEAPTYQQFIELANYFKLNIIAYNNSLKDVDFLEKIKKLNADIAIVCSYSKLLPKELLNIMPNRFVNVHPSILPDYRGANPYSNVIINGEEKTGITLHIMDEHFDTGDLIVSREVPLAPDETMGTLFNKLNYFSADLVVAFLQHFEQMNELKGKKQPVGEFKKADEITPQKGNNIINWNKSAKEIERFVRELNPFISALTFYKGLPIKIHDVKVLDKKINAPAGVILNVEKGLFVNTADGIIEIKIAQPGTFFIGNGKTLIKYFELKKGEKFSNG